jgi:TonB family protein
MPVHRPMRDTRRLVILAGMVQLCLVSSLAAQPRPRRMSPMRPPPPDGRQIDAADGDTIRIQGDDRVNVVRQRSAEVRVVFDAERRTAIVIADWGTPEEATPDGGVNRTWLFREVEGTWPLDARWQGSATILEPESLRGETAMVSATLTIETPAGPVVFIPGRPGPRMPVPPGAALWHLEVSSGGPDGVSFDEAEQHARSGNAQWSFRSTNGLPFGVPGGAPANVTAGTALGASPPMLPQRSPVPVMGPPVLRRVEPVWPVPVLPDVRGTVFVEIAVAPDGAVRSARVVRSLPPLDDLIIAAVSQWRLAPAGPEGRPDPQLAIAAFPYPPPPSAPKF